MREHARSAAAWLLVCALIACLGAVLFSGKDRIQTDLLALLPETEKNPVAEKAIGALNAVSGNRAIYLLGHADGEKAKTAARKFAQILRAAGAFGRVQAQVPPFDIDSVVAPYRDFRFGLLSDRARRELGSGKFDPESTLFQKLNNPVRLGSQDLSQDPFGFFDDFISSLPYRNLKLELEDDFLVTRDTTASPPMTYVLVTAELSGSAYDNHVQTITLSATEAAKLDSQKTIENLVILQTGSVFFAAAARSMAEREMHSITLISIAGISLLLLWIFRSLQPLVLCLLAVGAGLTFAVTATLAIQGELHLLTLVFGASLIGEAVDYPIQYVTARAAAGPAWNASRGLQQIRPGLTLALATSVLGYATLMLVPFPAIKQIALFALTGLTGAYLTVIFLLPFLLQKSSSRDLSILSGSAQKFIDWWRRHTNPGKACAIIFAVVILAAPGWMMIRTNDDVRTAVVHSEALLQADSTIRNLAGLGGGFRFFLIEGPSVESVLQREELLTQRLQMLVAKGEIKHYHAISAFVPSAARQAENRALLASSLFADDKTLMRILDNAGFASNTASRLIHAFEETESVRLMPGDWIVTAASVPYRYLWMGKTENGFATLVVPFGEKQAESLSSLTSGLQGVTLVDKAGSISRLFRDYRTGFSAGIAAALLAILLLLSRRYGWRRSGIILIPTLLGLANAVAVFGYAGMPVTLFCIMALMLIMGVGVNYTIFLIEGNGREGATFVAVLASAGTTLLSFGLLSLSGMAVLAQFGLTLLVGISSSVLFAPLALVLAFPKTGPAIKSDIPCHH